MAQTTSATLHPRPSQPDTPALPAQSNALPPLLHTPAGLALLELQGTINLPADAHDDDADADEKTTIINIGRVVFPDYDPDSILFDPASKAWMKKVYLFVGEHQRLTGEVKALPKALGVVRRRRGGQPAAAGAGGSGGGGGEEEGGGGGEDLEVVEVVKYKIVFSSRPEPVGTS